MAKSYIECLHTVEKKKMYLSINTSLYYIDYLCPQHLVLLLQLGWAGVKLGSN